MEYKAEKKNRKIYLFNIFEVEDEFGEKVRVRRLIGEKKYKDMLVDLDNEKKAIEKDLENANKRLEDLATIMNLVEEAQNNK